MKKFRTTLLNGYQRNAVDEYLKELTQELESLREDAAKGQSADQLSARLLQMEEQNRQLQRQLQEQNQQFQKQLQEQKLSFQKEREQLLSQNAQYAENARKLKKYESDYSSFMDLMVDMKTQARKIVTDAQSDAEDILVMARKDAEGITEAAQANAEKITGQAMADAADYRKNAENEMEKKKEEEAVKFQLARLKIAGYLDSLNRSQNKLLEVYEEFGRIVGQLPLRIGDVFSEKDFELLENPDDEKAAPSQDAPAKK